jgi:hypothetical protein
MRVVSRYRPARNRPPRSLQIPIASAASQCPTPRYFVLWRFSAAGRISAWKFCVAGG